MKRVIKIMYSRNTEITIMKFENVKIQKDNFERERERVRTETC